MQFSSISLCSPPKHINLQWFRELSACWSGPTPRLLQGSDKKIFNERESNFISQQREVEVAGESHPLKRNGSLG